MRTVATCWTRWEAILECVQHVDLKVASVIVFVEMLLGNVTKMGVRAKMDSVQLVVLKAALVIAIVGISQWGNVMKMGASGSLIKRMDFGFYYRVSLPQVRYCRHSKHSWDAESPS